MIFQKWAFCIEIKDISIKVSIRVSIRVGIKVGIGVGIKVSIRVGIGVSIRSVLGSELKSVIVLNTGLTIIYILTLRKSKLFRKDMYHFNNFITFIRC